MVIKCVLELFFRSHFMKLVLVYKVIDYMGDFMLVQLSIPYKAYLI